jgi:hypothetical protein
MVDDISDSTGFRLKISVVSLDEYYSDGSINNDNTNASKSNNHNVLSYIVKSPIKSLNLREEIIEIDIKDFPDYSNIIVRILSAMLLFRLTYLLPILIWKK